VQVTLDIPDDISAALESQWRDLPRQALEALAVEGYRTGALSETQVRRLLGFETRLAVHALLKEHRVPLRYTEADLEDDLAAHRALGILPER
jgi:predicted HTH domain antitoxin